MVVTIKKVSGIVISRISVWISSSTLKRICNSYYFHIIITSFRQTELSKIESVICGDYNYGHKSWDTLLKSRPVSVIEKYSCLAPLPPVQC